MVFDPVKRRDIFLSFSLQYMQKSSIKEYSYPAPHGVGLIEDIVYADLVGLSEEARVFLPRAIAMLNEGIAKTDIQIAESYYNYKFFYEARALGQWLRDDVNAVDDWRTACRRMLQFQQAELAKLKSPNKSTFGTLSLDDYMGYVYQAGDYELGIAEFEKYHGPQDLQLKQIMTPKALGYILCLHKARGRGTSDEMMAAGRKLLKHHLPTNWLGSGQAIRAAMWLKIVYWHADPTLTSGETLLKAYDNMLKVTRPDFV